jgi:hypothetical protein
VSFQSLQTLDLQQADNTSENDSVCREIFSCIKLPLSFAAKFQWWILLSLANQEEGDLRCVWHVWGEKSRIEDFGWETCVTDTTWKNRHRWEDNIKMDLQRVEWGAWTGLVWLWMETVGGLL